MAPTGRRPQVSSPANAVHCPGTVTQRSNFGNGRVVNVTDATYEVRVRRGALACVRREANFGRYPPPGISAEVGLSAAGGGTGLRPGPVDPLGVGRQGAAERRDVDREDARHGPHREGTHEREGRTVVPALAGPACFVLFGRRLEGSPSGQTELSSERASVGLLVVVGRQGRPFCAPAASGSGGFPGCAIRASGTRNPVSARSGSAQQTPEPPPRAPPWCPRR